MSGTAESTGAFITWKCIGCPFPDGCERPCLTFLNQDPVRHVIVAPSDGGTPRIEKDPSPFVFYPPTPQGWECPNCHRVNAPQVLECPCTVKPRAEGIGS